ncbi:MAG: hypothetical protein IPL93_07305 [Actinomycetales bacterium]|nr:hypothetical protein [Actinomycetales bacterium]
MSNIAAHALSDAGIEARCYTDFPRRPDADHAASVAREDHRRDRAGDAGLLQPTPQCRRPQPRARASPAVKIAGYNLSTSVVKAYAVSASGRVDVSTHPSNPVSSS